MNFRTQKQQPRIVSPITVKVRPDDGFTSVYADDGTEAFRVEAQVDIALGFGLQTLRSAGLYGVTVAEGDRRQGDAAHILDVCIEQVIDLRYALWCIDINSTGHSVKIDAPDWPQLHDLAAKTGDDDNLIQIEGLDAKPLKPRG